MPARRLPVPLTGVLALVFAFALAATSPAGALGAIGTRACADGFVCDTVPVPIDRSGVVPGTIDLSVARLAAAAAPTQDAVIGLAGGPGQAALPLRSTFAETLKPFMSTHDLLVFDQRGTGASGLLQCSALGSGTTSPFTIRLCASQIGPARGFYRSIDSADDIEALRVAGGYRKLVLYGVSYGTKVALTYAARYPGNVAALILDSVVPVDGPDAFGRASFAAVPGVLRALCANRACRYASRNPRADLSALVAKLKRHELNGTITSPQGTAVRVTLTTLGLWQILLGGDVNPALRAELPGAMRAALRGDATPILRLRARAAGLTGTAHLQASSDDGSDALFAATRCEETVFPWQRTATTADRVAQARAAARVLPSAPFAPFGPSFALAASVMPLCSFWPNAAPAPAPAGPLPAVPTLVLDGAADLRTPVAQARAAVASIPGAIVDVVAQTGHSVLTSDLGGCAEAAVTAFAAGSPLNCTPKASPFTPTAVPPRTLAAMRGATKAVRTLSAMRATVNDVRRQLLGDAIAAQRSVTPGSRTGGLRGGVATVEGSFITFRRVSYVPGVRVSGTYATTDTGVSQFAVTGPAAAAGTLSVSSTGHITGSLGGKRIDAQAGGETSAHPASARGSLPPALRSAPRAL